MSIPVVDELRPLPLGIILALYPYDARTAQEIQRAPDSGGSPGTFVTIGYAEPGARTYWDIIGGAGPYWYRARHVRPGATSSAWTHAVSGTPRIIGEIPNVPKLRAPAIEVAWTRASSTTAALDLTITDPDRLVTAVRFNKREGSETADAFTGWVTTWDRSTGTIGTDGTLVRGEDVLVEAGQESMIRWEVDYVDEDGTAHTIAGAQTSQNADENSVTVYWQAVAADPINDTVPYDKSNGDLRNRTAGLNYYNLAARLPVGVIVTEVAANLYRQDTNGTAVFTFVETWEAGDTVNTVVYGPGTHATTAWDIVTVGSLSITIAATRAYSFSITLDNLAGAAADERLLWVRATYTRKSQAQVI
ncbi:MAG: hypothetical protein OEW52_00100 [Thermoleophilia bacterium]|nr:hypothetical protein [Thermoleophilia bacterium]